MVTIEPVNKHNIAQQNTLFWYLDGIWASYSCVCECVCLCNGAEKSQYYVLLFAVAAPQGIERRGRSRLVKSIFHPLLVREKKRH